jgi:hypothetical protein
MSKQFFYARLTFTPKHKIRTRSTPGKHEVVVEVPKNSAQCHKSEIIGENNGAGYLKLAAHF